MRSRDYDVQRKAMPWGAMAWAEWPGQGPPLVLLEGTGCDIDDWLGVLGELPEDVRVIAADFRGHGSSEGCETPYSLSDLADDVLALLADLGVPEAVLVGHSLGGMVALDAARRSERVGGLVLLEGWSNGHGAGSAFGGPQHHYGTLSDEAIAVIGRKLGRTQDRFPRPVWDDFVKTVRTFDAADYLASAEIPIVEVYGETGRTGETESILAVPANPNIRWVWIPDSGHYLPHERPREVAAACAFGWEACRQRETD